MNSSHVDQPIQVADGKPSYRQTESSDARTTDHTRLGVYTQNYGSFIPLADDDEGFNAVDTDPDAELALHYSVTDAMMTPMSFRRLIRLYSFVPITAFSTILFFILLRSFLWPAQKRPSSFALHLGLVILGAAAWTVSFALRVPIYLLSCLICRTAPASTPFISASFQVFIEECLRLASLILARLSLQDSSNLRPDDPAFSRMWTLALGWAAAEVAVSVYQGYGQLFLYSDLKSLTGLTWSHPRLLTGHPVHDPEDVSIEEIDQVLCIRARTELEALYGIPVPDIPVFVSCLLRIDSITLSVALFLVISSSYLSNLYQSFPEEQSILQAIRATLPTFLIIFVLRTILSFSWTLNVLPKIGLHAASYMSCMFALGAFFVGLGRWDAV